MTERRCPRQHKAAAGWPLDRYLDGSGWKCPGLAPDGSDCGYQEPDEFPAPARWRALRKYLAAERVAHHEVYVSCDGAELAGTKLEQGGIVQGLERALAKMTELEAGR